MKRSGLLDFGYLVEEKKFRILQHFGISCMMERQRIGGESKKFIEAVI